MAGLLRLLFVAGVAAAVVTPVPAGADAPGQSRTYTNPVSAPDADTFADPAVIRGKDGWWYAFGTSDPLREGERTPHLFPIMRSSDLTHWEYRGDAFSAANRPSWATPTAGLWAPDIRYLDGRYLLYYTVTDTTAPGDDSAIGVATAPTPMGPWSDSGGPVIAPRPDGGGFKWTFDPAMLTDTDGRHWLYYGSYYGGIQVVPLSADGLVAAGPAVQVAIDNRYEGAYVVRRGDWYYLFGSAANCCAGPTTGYSVFAGRSALPTGPFVDRDGVSLLTSRVGGTPVVQPNGNEWIGTGHNAVVTDAAGQDWLAYHAIHRDDPFLDESYGINERPMLLDRLDWIEGWPTVRAGEWASSGRERAPVATGVVDDDFERAGPGRSWRAPAAGWTVVPAANPDSGGLLRHGSAGSGVLAARSSVPSDLHVDADVRVTAADGAAGVAQRVRDGADQVTARIDRAAGAMVTDVVSRGRHSERATPLPAGFDHDSWHTLTLHVDGSTLTATVTSARLGDPIAVQTRALPRLHGHGDLALTARGTAEFDNVSAAAAADPVHLADRGPRPGRLDRAYSDEFDGALGAGWTWVRPDQEATVVDGALRWPTEASDLVGDANTAGVLLREAPAGDYMVETRLTIDLGVDTVRNYQQAGLVAYRGDDDFARLSHVAIWNTRQVEFGRELPFADRLSYGGMVLSAPAETTWLRLAHTVDRANGEHEFRAASSRDGVHWTWGGTWTFPAGAAPRIGLVSHGGDDPQATALFDYVRVYRR